MRNRLFIAIRSLSCLAAIVLVAGPVQALSVIPGSSRLDLAAGCGDTQCLFSPLYALDAPAELTGTVDRSGLTLTFSIDLASATLSAISGNDGGVTSVDFTLNYSGAVTLVDEGSGQFSVTDQTGTLNGSLFANGPDTSTLITNVLANVTGICDEEPGGALTCGLTFGAGSGFPVDVNGNVRYFRHTIDITAIPEPGTAMLLGLGLLGLASRGRAR